MGDSILTSFIKIIIFLPLVIMLAYVSLKIGGSRVMGMGGRIIRIVEKVPLTNKSFLCVAVINGKPYVISSSDEKVEILMELPEEALNNIKRGEGSFKDSLVINFNRLLKRKDRV
jgi:flagellar protein FliO/FliZ